MEVVPMNRIRELREQFGWKQDELAKKLGVGRAAVSKYETEKIPLTTETIQKLCSIFDVSPGYLLYYEEPRKFKDKLNFIMMCNVFSPKKLSVRMNVPVAKIKKWLSGEKSPSDHDIISIAKIFNVSTDYFLYEEIRLAVEPKNLTENEWAALDIYRETNGELVGKSLFYSEEDKEMIFPILKKIKAAPEGLPLSQEQQELLTATSDLSSDDLKKTIEYVELLKLKRNS